MKKILSALLVAGFTWQASATIILPLSSTAWFFSASGDVPANYIAGQAPFANDGRQNTLWPENTTFWVKTTIDLSGYDLSSVSYKLGIDNDLNLFVNGTNIRHIVHDGVAFVGDFTGSLDVGNHLTAGINEIKLQIIDRGAATFFDMEIDGTTAVPESATFVAGVLMLLPVAFHGFRSLRRRPVAS